MNVDRQTRLKRYELAKLKYEKDKRCILCTWCRRHDVILSFNWISGLTFLKCVKCNQSRYINDIDDDPSKFFIEKEHNDWSANCQHCNNLGYLDSNSA